jgi:hypothetical protein
MPQPDRPRSERPAAEEKLNAAKKEIAARNRSVQDAARKARAAGEAIALEKRRRLDLS